MISCESFRTRFAPGTEDTALLAHLRTCDRCLDMAAHADPDVMFRALGGDEMIPPGGLDAFVGDVMQQVRVRGAETTVEASHNVVSWPRRLAVAATLIAGITGAMLYERGAEAPGVLAPAGIARSVSPVTPKMLETKPIVESYESESATIVEVPTDEVGDDVKIVMIFDENLPADL
ncbi:MAG TPA: hypothetical protein VE974_26240 [Thermoanaerobaculia bacterium]|nr:hypothetical protein [Thermoanaerobaculia bacterium]